MTPRWRTIAAYLVVAFTSATTLAHAQDKPPSLAPVPKECQGQKPQPIADLALPNTAAALRERKKINVLAIGASSIGHRDGGSGGYHALIEAFLETTFKGLDVSVVHRGISGELARDAAERIRIEIALNETDVVLWQVGTADAMARMPIDQLKSTVTETIDWLRQHKVDTVLIGLRYVRNLQKDQHYQAIRAALADVAKETGIRRVGRYEVVETIEAIRRQEGSPATETELSEAGYVCMAEYLARAVAMSLFAKDKNNPGQPTAKTP